MNMAPEQSTQTTDYTPSITSPPNTQQPPQRAPRDYQPYMQQGQFQQPYQQFPQSYGQPFAPYQTPAQQYQQQTQEVPKNKVWEWTKFGLHAVDIIFCIVGIAIAASIIGGEYGFIFVVSSVPVLVFAMVWDIAELITRCVRKFRAGIHPGAHVALSLLIWLGAGVVGGLEGAMTGFSDMYDEEDSCVDELTNEPEPCRTSSPRRAKYLAVTVFTSLVWLVHFILFVGACIDTSKRNALARRPITIIQPPYWGPMAQGWQPMSQSGNGMQQGQGHYMNVPQQGIPLEHRTASPQVSEVTRNGKEREHEPEQSTHAVKEYYTPSGAAV